MNKLLSQQAVSDNIKCGSGHCRGGHHWILKGTPYESLNSMNCGANQFPYTKDELRHKNSLVGRKEMWPHIK